MRRARSWPLSALAALALGLLGCNAGSGVVRIMDGRAVEGPYIPPETYAAFLDGAIAEERGDLDRALDGYLRAARQDDEDPEIWTRIAAVSCRKDARGSAAAGALQKALSLDASYPGALAARAACAMSRGEDGRADAARAAEGRPMSDEIQTLLANAESRAGATDAARARLVALTLVHSGSQAAWEALAAFARSHGDVTAYARALSELARRGLWGADHTGAAAVALAGEGEIAAARTVAAALADAEHPMKADAAPLAARLAVDDAVVRGDVELARRRAVRTHLGLQEAAARALLLKDRGMAAALAAPVLAADPQALGARLVLAVAALDAGDGRALSGLLRGAPRASDVPVPAPAAIAFGVALSSVLPPADARAVLARVRREPVLAGDAVVVPGAVELAARGVLPDDDLPIDAAVELAARRAAAAPPLALREPAPQGLDARHRLLAQSLATSQSTRTAELLRRMGARPRDPMVAVARARIATAQAQRVETGLAERVLAMSPADPLVAATALDLARRAGDAAVEDRARAALLATAQTPAERALLH